MDSNFLQFTFQEIRQRTYRQPDQQVHASKYHSGFLGSEMWEDFGFNFDLRYICLKNIWPTNQFQMLFLSSKHTECLVSTALDGLGGFGSGGNAYREGILSIADTNQLVIALLIVLTPSPSPRDTLRGWIVHEQGFSTKYNGK